MGNLNISRHSEDYYIHPRLGQILRVQEQNGQQHIQYTLPVPRKQVYEEWQCAVDCLSVHANNPLLLPLSHQFVRPSLCSLRGGHVQILYKGYMFVLQQQMENRARIKRPFSQAVLWHLLFCFARSLTILRESDLDMGEISPRNILVDEDGDLQILSQYSWPGPTSSLIEQSQRLLNTVKLFYERDHNPETLLPHYSFVSPQQLESGNQKMAAEAKEDCNNRACSMDRKVSQTPNLQDTNQSDIFAVGLTLLETAALKDCLAMYQISSDNLLVFNWELLNKYLGVIKHQYSPEFVWILKHMLRARPEDRIRTADLFEILKPHSEAIVNAQPFTISLLVDLDQNPAGRMRNFKRISLTDLQSKSTNHSNLKLNSTKNSTQNSDPTEPSKHSAVYLPGRRLSLPTSSSANMLTNFIYRPVGNWVPMHVLPHSQCLSSRVSVPLINSVTAIPKSTDEELELTIFLFELWQLRKHRVLLFGSFKLPQKKLISQQVKKLDVCS